MKQKLLLLDEPNHNYRVYPKEVVQKALDTNVVKAVLGCAITLKTDFTADVDLQKISHYTQNLRIEDNYLVGDVTVMKTPEGITLQTLLDRGCNIKFSPSGTGIVKLRDDEIYVVQDGYRITSIDWWLDEK